ncbi:hypothetical protein [Streptantibioticus ferralitis]|uniref:Cellulose synthase n=1 Tax=Streptantibioticus ferralitis TaxID=236510 RepID=A0ABT5Z639_9ACTN|nr:hypothetical protein [Streptantibioticus ferralitis]MDF2259263.1 hypothetical protein [Streptantibioticus ferralitis]
MLTATVCVALSGAGLAVALLTAWRRRFRRATRIAALALLPIGLYEAGLITLGGKIGSAVGSWAADLVFKPTVWAGFAVLALAVVLYVATRFGDAKQVTRAERKAAQASKGGPAIGAATSAPQLSRSKTAPVARPKGRSGADDALSDMGDIEEILKKHGI